MQRAGRANPVGPSRAAHSSAPRFGAGHHYCVDLVRQSVGAWAPKGRDSSEAGSAAEPKKWRDWQNLVTFLRLAARTKKTVPCLRIGMSVVGLEVPHVHVHLIPLNSMDDIRFTKKVKLEKEEFETLAKRISSHL